MRKIVIFVLSLALALNCLAVSVFAEENGSDAVVPSIPDPAPAVSLDNVTVSNGTVNAGETFTVRFSSYLYDANGYYPYLYYSGGTVTVSGGSGYFTLSGYLAEQNINSGTNSVSILCDASAPTGRYQVVLETSFTYNGAPYTASRTLNIDVIGKGEEEEEEEVDESNDKASFKLTSASIPEGKGKSNLSTKLTLSFTNKTNFEAKNLKIRLVGLGDIILNTYTDSLEAGNIAGGQSVNATFPIKFVEYPSAQTTLTVELTYDSPAGPQSETFNVYLQATEKEQKEEEAPSIDASLKPKVIVKSYNVDVESVVSGEEFTLTIVLENTSTKKDLENMTVKVTPGISTSSGTSSGPVFSLIDGTSSFYTDFFEKGGTKEYTIRMKCSSSAGAGSYPVDIDFDFQYERDGGGGYDAGSDSLSINLPVEQPVKFELMEWEPPTECGPDGVYISFQYFNKSRNPMSALAISVEGDFEMSTQYVGSLGASSYDYFSGTITPVDPTAVGETKTAILVFTFTDAADNEKRIEYPFDITITDESAMGDMWGGDMWGDEMMWGGEDFGFDDPGFYGEDMPVDGEGAESAGLPLWAIIAIAAGAVVVLGAVAVVVVKKVKAKREAEDEDD